MSPQSHGLESRRLLLRGCVQGAGIRPRVARLAGELGIRGRVRNTMGGVVIDAQSDAAILQSFSERLVSDLPGHPEVVPIRTDSVADFQLDPPPRDNEPGFRIDQSVLNEDAMWTDAPLDRVICESCLRETMTPSNRRFGYAFTSCSDCGPRYSIIESMPYDRERTSMSHFVMCRNCQSEYQDPNDRRYHCQTNSCHQCGPRIWWTDGDGADHANDQVAIDTAIEQVRAGRVVALKGVGGYQLICDATNHDAVECLRKRKGRVTKPLAVMVASLSDACQLAKLSKHEEVALAGPDGPILLAQCRDTTSLSKAIHPGLCDVGLMLPTTALHAWLCQQLQRPLVVTSGNREGDPLEFESAQAQSRLSGIADGFLHHDRIIVRPIDDSVVRRIRDRVVPFRVGRGIGPKPLDIPNSGDPSTPSESKIASRKSTGQPSYDCNHHSSVSNDYLAVGGHQKAAIAVTTGSRTVLGPHVGDLDTVGSRDRFERHVASLRQLYHGRDCPIAHDAHPDYHSTRWAENQRAECLAIQHHHAHVVATMTEHRLLDREVIGIAFDGTGLGPDGTIWGGEILKATAKEFLRVGHLRPFALPGGEKAIVEPWRIAASLLDEAGEPPTDAMQTYFAEHRLDWNSVKSLMGRRDANPITSSVGRLFDGIAAIALPHFVANHDGEAATRLEAACDRDEQDAYELPITEGLIQAIDWRPMIRQVTRDLREGVPAESVSMRFHRGVANTVARMAAQYHAHPIVFSGGVFQNRVLSELLAQRLQDHAQPVVFPTRIPPGDGGLAIGQIVIARSLKKDMS